MKKIISSFAVFLAALSLSLSPLYAEVDSGNNPSARQNAGTRVQNIKERPAEKRATTTRATTTERIKERRQLVAAKISEKRKIRITAFFQRMMERFGYAIARLNKLADRIESRLDKFEEKSRDVSGARAILEEAKTSIATAEAKVAEAKAAIDEALASDDPKTAFEGVRNLVHEARDFIKKAHQDLVRVVKTLKPARLPGAEETGTTTESSEE